ncbi:MAG: NUDIX hydrolase [Acidobacteria bacterium]|nr:NUDIX hydrolase [Acidobacteriota bacterium]
MKLKVLQSSKIYRGRILDLVVDRLEREDGEETVREVVRHPGGVTVVAELDGRILFVRQRRYPMDRDLLELPAGKLDGQEEPELAARRELEEETGYRATRLHKIGAFFSAPGYCDELLHLYVAEGLEKTARMPDAEEDIHVEQYDLRQAVAMIHSGEICDAKTAVGVLWLALEKATSATPSV